MRCTRRALLKLLTVTAATVAVTNLAACTQVTTLHERPPDDERAGEGGAGAADAPAAIDGTPGVTGEMTGSAADRGGRVAPTAIATAGPDRAVVLPETPTPAPPTPLPTATPRPRPQHALLNVPYYSQHIGRLNYCLPTSIAMIADRYNCLPKEVAGTRDRAPRFVADVAYQLAHERIGALGESEFRHLWEEIGTDPLQEKLWGVFAPNGRDLAAGMSPALAYLVLVYAFNLTPVLGFLDECMVALGDNVPSILFGTYGELRRADGQSPNVGGFTGDHALVLVGIDRERLLINDPLPSDKVQFSGKSDARTAGQRAVAFDLASVRRMTIGDGGKPRGDLFMVAPPGVKYLP